MERRRYERVVFLCKAAVALSGGAAVPAQTLDISAGGVGLITRAAFPAGTLVVVSFYLKDVRDGEVVEQTLGRVVNLRADLDGNSLGVEFLEPLDRVKHRRLLGRLLAAA